uniref:Uncharacterized protein n=1 Tax=Arundo donax TaxID=35708 RepID=A0A0A8Z2X4_ARUDO
MNDTYTRVHKKKVASTSREKEHHQFCLGLDLLRGAGLMLALNSTFGLPLPGAAVVGAA